MLKNNLKRVVKKVIRKNKLLVQRYRSGEYGLFGYFVGQVMRESHVFTYKQITIELNKQL